MATMFSSNWDEMRQSYGGPSIDASCKILRYLVKWFQRRKYLEIDQPETRVVYGGHVCKQNRTKYKTKQNLNIEPSIDASYQVSVHLAKQFQRRRFLEIDQPETRTANGSHVC